MKIDLRQFSRNYTALLFFWDVSGNVILATTDEDIVESPLSQASIGEYCYRICFPDRFLKPGIYYLTVSLIEKGNRPIDKHEAVMAFEIQDKISRRAMRQGGYRSVAIVAPEIPWELELVR